MKKLATLILCVIMSVGLIACTSEDYTEQDEPSEKPSEIEVPDEEIVEQNFERLGISNYEQIDLTRYEEAAGLPADKYISYHFFYENDGLQIEAYLSAPRDQIKENAQNPCLIYNHGGNREYGALAETDTLSNAYGLGMICLATNYRGCGNSEGEDEFGGDDVNDIVRLIDLCDGMDFIDSSQINMLGASRGGMMTYEVLRKDKRIRKAVIIAGITDTFMECDERSDMQTLMTELIGYTPEEKPEEYEKRSATYWANEINTPLMIFHTTGDDRVSIEQADKLVSLLEEYGKDYEYITIDSDVHGDMREEDWMRAIDWIYE